MNRFMWLIRRETWEHRAIWIAPAIVLVIFVLAVFTGNVHLGPIGDMDPTSALGLLPAEKQVKLLMVVYSALALVMFMVMGVIILFYALDSLYTDRRDRSVLFWKSLPLSDAETVLSKFTVAAVVMPMVAVVGALLSQLIVAAGGATKLALAGGNAAIMWQADTLGVGAGIAVMWALTAMLWYAPVIAYLMLASAWAPKGPFLWAVLPPVAAMILEKVLLRTEYVEDFFTGRLFGLFQLLDSAEREVEVTLASGEEVNSSIVLDKIDMAQALFDFYTSTGLWLGIVGAAALLGAAIWLRRYRDETA